MKKSVVLFGCTAIAAVLTLNSSMTVWATEETASETASETVSEAGSEASDTALGTYEYGTWEGNVYTNNALGFTMTFPEEYTVAMGDELYEMMGIGADTANSMIFEFLAMASDQNSGMMFCVEESRGMDSAAYAEMLLSTCDMMGTPLKDVSDPVILTLGDLEFYKQEFTLDYSGIEGVGVDEVYQTYLICTADDMRYYFNANATEETKDEIAEIFETLESTDPSVKKTEKAAPKQNTANVKTEGAETSENKFCTFTSSTHEGDEVTDAIFAEADLTMVNIWGTFCSPCIREMPDLGELADEYADKGLQIVGIICDVDEPGNELVQQIIDKTGADYTHIVASDDLKTKLLAYTPAVPTTYFVNSEGEIVGKAVEGSRNKEMWASIIEEKLGK